MLCGNKVAIVPPEEWIFSKYYAGPLVTDMYPFWKEKFIEVINEGVNEVILYGSIGGGKTYFANALLVRKIYELAVLKDQLWDTLGIAKGSNIFFIYFNVSLRQARFTGYAELVSLIDQIEFFRKEFPRDKSVDSFLRFPNNIYVVTGSEFQHQLGLNVLGAVLDEGNFRLAKDAFQDAFQLYNTVTTRRLSRFVKGGRDLGISILISSAKEPTSFVESKIREVYGNSGVKVIRVTGFEVKRNKLTGSNSSSSEGYLDDPFWVFVGNGYISPRIVDTHEDLREVLTLLRVNDLFYDQSIVSVGYVIEKVLPEGIRDLFVCVPGVFRKVFEGDIVRAIRDVIGISIAEDKLMRSVFAYEDAVDGKNLFTKDVLELSMYDNLQLFDYFDLKRATNKDKPRCVHVDFGISGDRTGIACAYIDSFIERDGKKLPVVRVEWLVGVGKSTAYKLDDQVPIWKIRNFLLWLREKGFNIKLVTFDRFQSIDTIQLLRRERFNVDLLSVDKDDSVYLNLVNLYLERRIKHPDHELYRKELFELEWDKERKKVDHVVGGSKDVADAVAGAVWSAVNNVNITVAHLEEFAKFDNSKITTQTDVLDVLLQEARKQKVGKWWLKM